MEATTMEATTMEAPTEARAAKTPLQTVDKSDLAGMISTARNRAEVAEQTAERFEALLAGLLGEPSGVHGGVESSARTGIYELTDIMDRTDSALNRINVCGDRLQSLISL